MIKETIAEKIAHIFGDDGQNFTSESGTELDEYCETAGGRIEQDDLESYELYRYVFEDDSAIVITGDTWDIEGSTPYSWRGLE